jgi:FAD/FMN-containing dehydrogenase
MLPKTGLSFLILALAGTQPAVAQVDGKLRDCLNAAVGGDKGRVAWHTKFAFDFLDVKRYNLRYDTEPAAVTYPEKPEEVGSIVKCAAAAKVAVQARSGGHSFGNYGAVPHRPFVHG